MSNASAELEAERSRSRMGTGSRWLVLALAVALGAYLRLRGLAELPLTGDEYHTLTVLQDGARVDLGLARYETILTTFDTVGSHVALPLLQRISMDLFGAGIVPFRLVAIVPGLLTLLLAYPLLRGFVGRGAALLATWLVALNPMLIYYARFARGYALALFLALVLGWALERTLDPARRGRASWCALIATATLLPCAHLSTLGFVLALSLTGIAFAWRESRALALRLCGAFALAAALLSLLYLPVFGQVVDYFRSMTPEDPPLAWFGVPTLIAGSRLAAWFWLVLCCVGAFTLWRTRRAALALTAAALVGPLALLLLTHPRGMDYAWARYVMSGLPFLAALVSAGFLALFRFVPRGLGTPFGLALGAALTFAQYWSGPIGPHAARDGAFSNTYLALHSLPAFDEPFPGAPEFYRAIASDPSVTRIVEATPLFTRAVMLYRNYALIHGKNVLVGWAGEMFSGIQNGPYVRLLELGPDDADYIVLHRDQLGEVPAYFAWVYETLWPSVRDAADDTFMRRQETTYNQNLIGADKTDPIAARLLKLHGPACYKDERILVWKLKP